MAEIRLTSRIQLPPLFLEQVDRLAKERSLRRRVLNSQARRRINQDAPNLEKEELVFKVMVELLRENLHASLEEDLFVLPHDTMVPNNDEFTDEWNDGFIDGWDSIEAKRRPARRLRFPGAVEPFDELEPEQQYDLVTSTVVDIDKYNPGGSTADARDLMMKQHRSDLCSLVRRIARKLDDHVPQVSIPPPTEIETTICALS